MAAKMGTQSSGINDINITPFVDVVLVLLIIFMISAPALISQGMKIHLPTAVNAKDMSHVTLNIYIGKDGQYMIDRKTLKLVEVQQLLTTIQKQDTHTDVIISADTSVSHGVVMELADSLRTLGIKQIGFATMPKTRQ